MWGIEDCKIEKLQLRCLHRHGGFFISFYQNIQCKDQPSKLFFVKGTSANNVISSFWVFLLLISLWLQCSQSPYTQPHILGGLQWLQYLLWNRFICFWSSVSFHIDSLCGSKSEVLFQSLLTIIPKLERWLFVFPSPQRVKLASIATPPEWNEPAKF